MALIDDARAALAAAQLAEEQRERTPEEIQQHLEDEQRKQAEKDRFTQAQQAINQQRQTGNGGPAERAISQLMPEDALLRDEIRGAAPNGGISGADAPLPEPEPEPNTSRGEPSEYELQPAGVTVRGPDTGPGFGAPVSRPSTPLYDQAVAAMPKPTPEQLTAEIQVAQEKRQENIGRLAGRPSRHLFEDSPEPG